MSQKPHEAPRPVGIAAWATAVVGAFILAVTVGLFVYNTISAPIAAETCAICPFVQKWNKCYVTVTDKLSKGQITQAQYKELTDLYDQIDWESGSKNTSGNVAKAQDLVKKCEVLISGATSDTTTSEQPASDTGGTTTSTTTRGKCPVGHTQYAINNYPMTDTSVEDNEYFERMELKDEKRCYRCSDICVKDGIKLEGYLSKLYAGVEKITVVRDKAEFKKLVDKNKKVARESAVILSSTKAACEGPISIDYPGLLYDGKTAVKAAPNDRCTNFWKRQKKAASSTSPSGTAGAPPSSSTQMGMFNPQAPSQPSGASESAALSKLKDCLTKLAKEHLIGSKNDSISALLDGIAIYIGEDNKSEGATQGLLERCLEELKTKTTGEAAVPEAAASSQLTQTEINEQVYNQYQKRVPSGSSLVQIDNDFYAIPNKFISKEDNWAGFWSLGHYTKSWSGRRYLPGGVREEVYIDMKVHAFDGGLNAKALAQYKLTTSQF